MSMKKKYNMFIPCEEAQHTCDKSQYKEASLMEQLKLNIHLVFCRACQKYVATNNKLTKIINKGKTPVNNMKSKEKIELEQLFNKELSKQ